jgi:hypothetical protein
MPPEFLAFFDSFERIRHYMGYIGNGYCVTLAIPGESLTYPYDNGPIWQRSPVAPLTADDEDYVAYGAAYGTPYQMLTETGTSFVLPDMYVPNNVTHELSFGAGFYNINDLGILSPNSGESPNTTLTSDIADNDSYTFSENSASAADISTDNAVSDSKTLTTSSDEGSSCSSLGLSLIAALAFMGLMLIKFEEE